MVTMSLLGRLILGLLIVYWLAIFVATHLPPTRLPETGVGDKTAHVVGYFGLGVLLYLWLWLRFPTRRWTGVWVLGICMVYGVMDELLQIPIGRHATVGDWIADIIGAGMAVAVMEVIRCVRPVFAVSRHRLGSASEQSR
jgi:VanZ family protein